MAPRVVGRMSTFNRKRCMNIVLLLTLVLVATQLASMWRHSFDERYSTSVGGVPHSGLTPRHVLPRDGDSRLSVVDNSTNHLENTATKLEENDRNYIDFSTRTVSQAETLWSMAQTGKVPILRNDRGQIFLSGNIKASSNSKPIMTHTEPSSRPLPPIQLPQKPPEPPSLPTLLPPPLLVKETKLINPSTVSQKHSSLPIAGKKAEKRLIFLKFHQVGGTTIADRLLTHAEERKWKACCAKGCDVCAQHTSLQCKFNCLGASPINPAVVITILREPVDKSLARFYFQASRDDYGSKAGVKVPLVKYVIECQNQDLPKPKQCPNEYLEVLGNGNLKEAHRILSKVDVIGTTEAFDDFMIMLALRMNWPLSMVTYKRLKTVLGRPKVSDHPPSVLEPLRIHLAPDIDLYAAGASLAQKRLEAGYGTLGNGALAAARLEFARLESRVDQSCSFESHGRNLVGKDCYEMHKDAHLQQPPQ